jgi:hypothetical protein
MLISPFQETQVKRVASLETERSFISSFLQLCLIGQCLALGGSLRDSAQPGLESGRQDNRAQPVLRWRGLSCLIILLCSLHCSRAPGQVIPSVRLPPRIAIFGTFNALKPAFHKYGDDVVYGGTFGGYIQSPYLFGLEMRGSIDRWGGHLHQEAVLAGPRATLHLGRFNPYGAVLGGGAQSWAWKLPVNPKSYLTSQISPDIAVVGGIDYRMAHHISLRLGEVTYSHIFRSDQSLNSFAASAGVVYRIPW